MNTTISNNGLPLLPQPSSSPANGAATGGAAAPAAGPSASPDDRVNLTDSAKALQNAARVDGHSAIDSQRVEKLRQAIASGSYQINPAGIADKMLAFDAQMGGTTASKG